MVYSYFIDNNNESKLHIDGDTGAYLGMNRDDLPDEFVLFHNYTYPMKFGDVVLLSANEFELCGNYIKIEVLGTGSYNWHILTQSDFICSFSTVAGMTYHSNELIVLYGCKIKGYYIVSVSPINHPEFRISLCYDEKGVLQFVRPYDEYNFLNSVADPKNKGLLAMMEVSGLYL